MLKLATLCYLRSGSKTLMLHRIKKERDMHAGKWNGLGGKFLPGETPEACAIREVQEESGLTMRNPILRGILTFPGFAAAPEAMHEANPDLDDWYTFVFIAHDFAGELIESDEGVLAWIDDEELFTLNLWEGDRIFLHWLEQDAFFSGRFAYVDGVLMEHDVVFYQGQQIVPNPLQSPMARTASHAVSPQQLPSSYRPTDDTFCWVCNGPVQKRHCKIICQICGFTRDCSDP